MKSILNGVFCLAIASSALADATINITGSTAFRAATHDAILGALSGETYAYIGATLGGSNQAIFIGTVTGISGTTTVRTSWSGSAAGIRDVAQANSLSFLPANTPTSASGTANTPAGTDPGTAKFALSDVFQTSTIFTTPALTNSNIAVVPFVYLCNEGAPAALTNVTDQIQAALYSTSSLPLSLFTGNAADVNTLVYPTGRDAGSGTRITVLAETGYGIFLNVQQFTGVASGNAITELTFVGNGGYASGSGIRDLLPNTATNVTIKDENGTPVLTGQNIVVLGYTGESDALTAQANGARILKYNGFDYTPENVRNGQYTLWGFEHFYNVTGLSADESAFKTAILNAFPAALGTTGISISSMKVGRGSDGGLVGPQ